MSDTQSGRVIQERTFPQDDGGRVTLAVLTTDAAACFDVRITIARPSEAWETPAAPEDGQLIFTADLSGELNRIVSDAVRALWAEQIGVIRAQVLEAGGTIADADRTADITAEAIEAELLRYFGRTSTSSNTGGR